MGREWVVVVEATPDGSTPGVNGSAPGLDEAMLSRAIDVVSDARPIALYHGDRYAIQLRVTAASPSEALEVALRRWSDAICSVHAPVWDVVRADVMSESEFELDVEMSDPIGSSGSAVADGNGQALQADGAGGPDAPSHSEQGGGDLESELRWRLILQDFEGLLILLSAEGEILFSLASLDRSGTICKNGTALTLADIAYADDAVIVRDAVTKLVSGGADTVTFSARLRGRDGWRSYEATARNLLDEPLVRAIVVNGEDITRRNEFAVPQLRTGVEGRVPGR